jgi:4-amino-4-deoxy-L-arabinose transferase-like glycosyltransferase
MTLSPPAPAPPAAPSTPAGDVAGDGPPSRSADLRRRARGLAPEAAVLVGAAVLGLWALGQNGTGNNYYGAAVRSMTGSLHDFLFGSYDPGGWITTDKPPFPYWVAAAVVKVFGYSSWTLLLPSAVAGVISVALLMATVRPLWGRWAAVVAGAVLALTPAALAVSRSNNPDAILLTLVTAAAWATVRALRDGRTRWLLAAGAFVGLAFLSKLLAGFMILPALWFAYLVAGPGPWTRRIVQLLAASAVVVAVAGAWVAVVDLTPLDQRPFIGGSRDGSARDLALGYDGLGRVFGQGFGSDADSGPFGGGFPGPGGGGGFPTGLFGANGIDQFGGSPGAGRLFNNGMGDQIMWLLPVAVAAGAVALVDAVRRRAHQRAQLGALVAFVTWLGVTAVVYSTAKGIFHNYYVSYLAPPLAALVGIGVGRVLGPADATRVAAATGASPVPDGSAVDSAAVANASGGEPVVPTVAARRTAVVALAVGLGATVPLQLVLLRRVAAWEWLRLAVPIGTGLAVVLLLAGLARPLHRVGARLLIGAGAVGGLIITTAAPAAWSLSALQAPANGLFPDARPVAAGGLGAPGAPGAPGAGGAPGGFPGFDMGIPKAQLDWLIAQRTTEKWLLAVPAAMQASDAIIDGHPVMAMGGFMGADPAMTKERLADLVDRGELRFLSAGGFLPFGGAASGSAVAAQICTAVPPSTWGGTGSAGVLDCRGKGDAIRTATPPATVSPGAPRGGAQGAPGGFDFPAFVRCLVDHGVEVNPSGPPNFSDPKLPAALQACGAPPGLPGMPGAGPGGPGGPPPLPGGPMPLPGGPTP